MSKRDPTDLNTRIKVGYSSKVQLRQFEPIEISTSVERDLAPGEKFEDAHEKCFNEVCNLVEDAMDEMAAANKK